MTSAKDSLVLAWDPVWPWSLPGIGPILILVVAVVLVALTIWTYRGARGAGRRIATLIALRLAALAVILLVMLRPSLAARDELHLPSTLLIAVDASESMTIQDEFDNQPRWDYLRRLLRESEPQLQRLQDEHNVRISLVRFAGEVEDFDPQGEAAGKRTDFGQMLQSLLDRHGHERYLRGLLVLSDGADNGRRFPSLELAGKWRSLPCPVQTFAFGSPTTTTQQRDLALRAIHPDPSPLAVKGRLSVKGTLDAPGFETATVRVRLLVDDKEVAFKEQRLTKAIGNEVQLGFDAPAKPGEIKVTLKVDPVLGELSLFNNEISTFVTVTKEGVSVLYVEGKIRAWEPKFIRYALGQDPRIRLYEAVLPRNGAPTRESIDLFQFDKQHYDVVIVGDISAKRFSAGNPQTLGKVNKLIGEKGAGLLMMGGYESFANSDWAGTEVAQLLPVELDAAGQVETPVQMLPTPEGLQHYVLRLSEKESDNKALWDKLPRLQGMTRLGRPKVGATVLAATPQGVPILIGQRFGEGRVLAFGGDTTWMWRRTPDGAHAHARFWKQLVLWLARQDETEGSVWVKPDTRRLPAGGKLGFNVGLRGKGGIEIKDGRFDVSVLGPGQAATNVPTTRDVSEERGVFWKTDQAGEYRLVVRGRGKDQDGSEISGEAVARFLVFQDEAELVRAAADHEFLTRLALAGGGRFHRGEELPQFLGELAATPLPQSRPKAQLWPDWRRNPPSTAVRDQAVTLAGSGILLAFLLFVALLGTEWGLRRHWGLV